MVSIDVLPDDVLLDIFDFCVDHYPSRLFIDAKKMKEIQAWQTLVHVCRRWRIVVFGSPLGLNLALVCTDKTARDTLDVWPPLPLAVWSEALYGTDSDFPTERVDNIIAVLERSDRVFQISLTNIPNSSLETILAVAQKPFPELMHLLLSSHEEPVIPESFLGGSAPRLRSLWLDGILFLGLPKLLLSATHLVDLFLLNIPHSGYISPEVMVTTLSTLTSLRILCLAFRSPQYLPDQEGRRQPPLNRSLLPVLTAFMFKGVSEYLECLVVRIDTPQLNRLQITFFDQIIFDTPQLMQFVIRTPWLKGFKEARVTFGDGTASVNLSSVSSPTLPFEGLNLKISCRELDRQVSSLEQVCTSSFPPLPILEHLYIHKVPNSQPDWQDNVENTPWLELLHLFPAVKNLYLCEEFAPRVVRALQELVGVSATEVLPNLQNIFLEELQESGPVREGIQKFIGARQVTSHPIAVSLWENSQQDREKILRY